MTTTWDELKFYGKLARNLFTRGFDLHKIPGPPPNTLRILGNIPNIMRPDYHVQMLEWANEYGGIYKFSLGCQWVIVISDPHLAAQVLGRGASSVPRKCVGYQFFDMVRRPDMATNHLGRRSFFTTSDEPQWAAVRKAAAPAFNMANVRRSFPHVLRHAQGIADELQSGQSHQSVLHAEQQGQTVPTEAPIHGPAAAPARAGVDIQEQLELALLNVFVEALFDIEAKDFPGHEVAAAMNLVLEEANERLKVPLRGFGTWIAYPKLFQSVCRAQQLLGDTYGYLADVVRSRRGSAAAETSTNLWACLARLKDPHTGEPLSREQLIPEIGAFMMAGFDTSSHTIAWCLFTLATEKDAQRQVHEELQSKGLLRGADRAARDPCMDDLSQLPLLNCIIDETMRMYPVAATASVREVVRPVRVGDYTLPRGVIVWPMLYALHNANHNWDHPERFMPERWRDKHMHHHHPSSSDEAPGVQGRGAQAQEPAGDSVAHGPVVRDGRASRAFLPFSDGMKNCLGQNLGLMEVRTVLAVLLSRFKFELHPDLDAPQQVTRNMIMSLTLKIKGGLNLVATPLDAHPIDTREAAEAAKPNQELLSSWAGPREDEDLAAVSHSSVTSHVPSSPGATWQSGSHVRTGEPLPKEETGFKVPVAGKQQIGTRADKESAAELEGRGALKQGWGQWMGTAKERAVGAVCNAVAASRGLVAHWQGVDGEQVDAN